MSWAIDAIAAPMGFKHCVLFPRARDAIAAYHEATKLPLGLPSNVCPQLVDHMRSRGHEVLFGKVNPLTGLSEGAVQLYGYRQEFTAPLEIDPLMTGWGRKPVCESAVVSFGLKKFISIGHGGALLTNDEDLAQRIEGYWPFSEGSETVRLLKKALDSFQQTRLDRFERIAAWDAALGRLLPRIPLEQVIPWRVMRRVPDFRDLAVSALHQVGIPVGTNYPSMTVPNRWGSEVINFFPECTREKEAAEIIARTLHG